MFNFLKRKHSSSEVAQELSKMALRIEEEQQNAIDDVSSALAISAQKVVKEYRHFRVYMVESVVHTISSECDAGESFRVAFETSLKILAVDQGLGNNFWAHQQKRTPIYDNAWQDMRGVGVGTAMATAFASQLKSEDDFLEVLPLSLFCTNLLPPLVKYCRKLRIVKN